MQAEYCWKLNYQPSSLPSLTEGRTDYRDAVTIQPALISSDPSDDLLSGFTGFILKPELPVSRRPAVTERGQQVTCATNIKL